MPKTLTILAAALLSSAAHANDPRFSSSWHLLNTGQSSGTPGMDINVVPVWPDYTGTGVSIGIYDNGVDITHADLLGNYDSTKHIVHSGTTYTGEYYSPTNDRHGTPVAGIISALRNGYNGQGIAYGARFTMVPVNRSSNNLIWSLSATYAQSFDVVNLSFGSIGTELDQQRAARQQNAGVQNAITNGRGGLGTILVRAAGNNRSKRHQTNMSVDSNEWRETIVAACGRNGRVLNFSNYGPSLLLCAPGTNIVTTDITGTGGYASSDVYTSFSGTSAAAPMVTGVVALVLQANPTLSWRDVQEVLRISAKPRGFPGEVLVAPELFPWVANSATNWNGGGAIFSNDYGFGLVNAHGAVRLAETWTARGETTVFAPDTIIDNSSNNGLTIPDNGTWVEHNMTVPAGVTVDWALLTLRGRMRDLTHVEIELVSPAGTVSPMLKQPPKPAFDPGYFDSELTSNAFRGEPSGGVWKLRIRDVTPGYASGSSNCWPTNVPQCLADASLVLRGAPSTADTIYFYTPAFATLGAEPARQTLADASGIDTINASAVPFAMTLDLRPGNVSTVMGQTFTIASGTVIENAYAGDGADFLTGNDANNILRGGRGNDILDGGPGFDTAVFRGPRASYTIGSGTITGPDGTDTFTNIEQLQFADETIPL